MKIKLEQSDLDDMARLWVEENFVNKSVKSIKVDEKTVTVEVTSGTGDSDVNVFNRPDLGEIQRGGVKL